jgi:hypothetical protein
LPQKISLRYGISLWQYIGKTKYADTAYQASSLRCTVFNKRLLWH